MTKADVEIFISIERFLKQAGEKPQTCFDVFDDKVVSSLVDSANQVSDYLNHMWRRGQLQRYFPAVPSAVRARHAYTWKEAAENTPARLKSKATRKPHLRLVV